MNLARRQFFTSSASGLGALALASLLQQDGLLAADSSANPLSDPLAPKAPHFAPKAKNCIFFLPEGAPSHIDLFDPKPKLAALYAVHLRTEIESSGRADFHAFVLRRRSLLADGNSQSKN
jgi:hypothetical protein